MSRGRKDGIIPVGIGMVNTVVVVSVDGGTVNNHEVVAMAVVGHSVETTEGSTKGTADGLCERLTKGPPEVRKVGATVGAVVRAFAGMNEETVEKILVGTTVGTVVGINEGTIVVSVVGSS